MKRVIVLLCVGMAIVACSKSNDNSEVASSSSTTAPAAPIKIGVILSETGLPNYMAHSRNAIDMLVDETNARGGLRGRPVEVIYRDDRSQAGDALQAAEELVAREQVTALFSHTTTHITLAISEYSRRQKIPFFAVWCTNDLCTWRDFHPYIFAYDMPPAVSAKDLAMRAAAMNLDRWGTVAVNIDYGHSMVDAFERELKALQPEVEFVAEQWPKWGNFDAGATIQALRLADPQGVFNVLWGSDLIGYIREARQRDFMDGIAYISNNAGRPEDYERLGQEIPVGWLTTGYPADQITDPKHQAWRQAYRQKFGMGAGASGLDSYVMMSMLLAAIEQSKDLTPDQIVAAAEQLSIDSPVGEVSFRTIDHRGPYVSWVGEMALRDGKPMMINFESPDFWPQMPSDEWILEQRAQK